MDYKIQSCGNSHCQFLLVYNTLNLLMNIRVSAYHFHLLYHILRKIELSYIALVFQDR